jgi:hypothetical protein
MTTPTLKAHRHAAKEDHTTPTKSAGQSSTTGAPLVRGASARSPRRTARTAGVLYLLIGVLGAFAMAVVYPKVYVAGDATATAQNLAASTGLLRVAIPANLVQAAIWVLLAVTLYRLLQHVNKVVAATMVALVAIGAGITMVNEILGFEALQVVTGHVDMTPLGSDASNAVILLLLDSHQYGVLIAQIFMGLWLIPLGRLAYTSGLFPKPLGVLLVVAALCYLVGTLAAFLLPDSGLKINTLVTTPCGIPELWMVFYLLVIGVKTAKPVVTTAAVS